MSRAPRRVRFSLHALVAMFVAMATVLLVAGGAPADPPPRPYLALGDSVVFGYITSDGFAYANADNFVGYPDYVGRALRLSPVNAACPGEATGGFLSSTGADNGCRAFRSRFPLHVAYAGTQMDFATSFLTAHPETRLVSLGLGANDAFLLEHSCNNDPQCIGAGLPSLLATVAGNVDTILKGLRATNFHGVLVVVNYYSLDYTDAVGTGLTQALNTAIASHAAADGAVVADAFTAFRDAASTPAAAGNTCHAGLLNVSPASQLACDVHPSQSGQQLLARTVATAYDVATGG